MYETNEYSIEKYLKDNNEDYLITEVKAQLIYTFNERKRKFTKAIQSLYEGKWKKNYMEKPEAFLREIRKMFLMAYVNTITEMGYRKLLEPNFARFTSKYILDRSGLIDYPGESYLLWGLDNLEKVIQEDMLSYKENEDAI